MRTLRRRVRRERGGEPSTPRYSVAPGRFFLAAEPAPSNLLLPEEELTPGRQKSLTGREAPGTGVVEREAGREEARLCGVLPPPAMRDRKHSRVNPKVNSLITWKGVSFLASESESKVQLIYLFIYIYIYI